MTALQSQTTGGSVAVSFQSVSSADLSPRLEPGVLVSVRRQDEIPQHFVAAFLPGPSSEQWAAWESKMPCSPNEESTDPADFWDS